ncbi:AMP-binding protein [Cupriavidus sp. 2KB_3]|uniref:AMP-binding protein n=1 Tax=Cupriavidus TaxID=106589 RepID=UPI0011F03CC1|nr:AMP-binding protein [Cupriavidus campinensis]
MTWEPRTLAAVLAQQARLGGSRRALVTPDGAVTWTELQVQSRRVAKALLARGVKRGDFVGLLCGNDAHWVASFYGAALIGAVTVPVNTRFKAPEIEYCLRESDVRLLILADRFLKIDFMAFLREVEPAVDQGLPGQALPLLGNVVVVGSDVPRAGLGWEAFLAAGDVLSDEALADATRVVTPDDLLLIQFTSGTTAYPKGVMLTHDNMLRNASAVGQRLGIEASDCYFNCRPFFHVAGSTLSLLCALCAGASIATLPTFDAGAALAMMEQERCTFISGNETLFQMLISHPSFDRSRLHLRGGWAAAGPDTMQRIIDEMGIERICWAYGLSEASPNVAINDWRDDAALRVGGLARPHDGVAVRIIDEASGTVCGADEVGEIQVKGWGVMRGYYKQPEANAKVFTADGWLRTGDLGALRSDGCLRLVGRLKDVFRVGGENVAPAEVEQALLSHPAVASAQVVGVPDARLGEVPAAFVTLKAGMTLDAEALLAWARPRMANFRAPRYAEIVTDFERIGMTASGKVQKNKLREHAIALFHPSNP